MPSDLPSETTFCLGLLNEPTSSGNLPLPGITEESTQKLVEKLKANYVENNAFFDGTIFHNHVMDHLLALWSFGGTPEALDEVYRTHDYQERVKPSPEPITDSNFVEHLGDASFYFAYMTYFCKALAKSSVSEVVNRFVFSSAYNVNPNLPVEKKKPVNMEPVKHPEMLARFMAGVLHPLIHLGYGAEFGIVQQIAEGLAMTAIHPDYQTPTTPLYLFTSLEPYSRGLSKLSLPTPNAGPPPFLSFHKALAIDPRFSPAGIRRPRPDPANPPQAGDVYFPVMTNQGPLVMDLVNEWYDRWTMGVPEDQLEDRLEKMVEDVIVGNVFWYGVSGVASRGENVFNADFLAMHFVTSAIFIPTLTLPHGRTKAKTLSPPLPLASRLQLLRTYLASCAIWYIASYRPSASKLSVAEFYAATDAKILQAPAPHAYRLGKAPHREFFKNTQKTVPVGTAAWFRIFQSTVVHPNEHLVKIVRALGAMDLWYGRRGKGTYAGALDGAEGIDGSIFLRTAVLTLDRLGWAQEEEPKALWDRLGFYDAVVGDDVFTP